MKKNGEPLTLIELVEEETSPYSFSIRDIKNAFKTRMKHSTHYIKLINENQGEKRTFFTPPTPFGF